MATSLLLGIALIFEPKEADVMARPPRQPDAPILTRELIMRTMFVGSMMLLAGFGIFEYELFIGATEREARTAATGVIVVVEIFYLFNCRSLIRPLSSVGFFSNPWTLAGSVLMVLCQLAFTYLPVMNTLFDTAPIPATTWLHITASGLLVFILVNLEKRIRLWAETRRS